MDVQRAAFDTITLWKSVSSVSNPPPEPLRDPQGLRLYHAMWMLDQVRSKENREWGKEKLNRWLGYAQALLVTYRVLTLEQVKRVNKNA